MAFTKPRRPSNDGNQSSVVAGLSVRPSLIYAVLGAPQPCTRRAPMEYGGPKPRKNASIGTGAPDELVLEVRRMREHRGMSVREIAAACSLAPTYVAKLCDYVTRGHLDPGPRPAPEKA